MIVKLRETLQGRRTVRIDVCDTCGVAGDAGCRAMAAREAVVGRASTAGLL